MKRKIWIASLSVVCAAAFGFGAYNVASVQANASESATLWTGFEISATAVRTANPTGLRFKTDVERLTPTMKKYNPDAEYYTTLTLTTANGQSWSTTVEATVWRPDGSGWNTVLLDIPESDYATQVTAQSFVRLNGTEDKFYQTEPVTVSIAQTAAAAVSYGATGTYVQEYYTDIVTGVTLDKTSATLEQGQALQLSATTNPTGYQAKFTSSNNDIATVDAKGKVTAKNVGSATITAEINGYTASCQIIVTARTETLNGFASSTSMSWSGSRTVTISGSWLDGVFADERIDAFTFDINSNKAMELTADNGYTITLSADTTKNITFTRSMYEVIKASGVSDLVLTSNLSKYSSATINYSNFKKVWAIEASQTLSAMEILGLNGLMPEYVGSKQFDFYGYGNPSDGKWKIDGVEYSAGEDFRTVERYEEYKETGMNIFFPQSSAQIDYGKYNMESTAQASWNNVKVYYDRAYQAGLTKGIFNDERLRHLSTQTQTLIGPGKSITGSGENYGFETQAQLDAYVAKCLSLYSNHPIFYGVYLQDEPSANKAVAYGETYAAIKRVMPDCFVQYNLLPLVTGWQQVNDCYPAVDGYDCTDSSCTLAEAIARYKAYVNLFLDTTGADHVCYDHYPLAADSIKSQYIIGLQTVAQICKERDVEFHFVAQTFAANVNGSLEYRAITEEDARWLNNMLLGFGVNNIAYYTYWTKSDNKTDGEYFLDGNSFVTRYGETTDIYYWMREIMAENQAFAPTILSFDYQASAVYTVSNAYGDNHIKNCIQETLNGIANVTVNTESALITQLYDSVGKRNMYMVQNVIDARYQTAGSMQTVQLKFSENYDYAIVWKNGEKSIVRLVNNTYVVRQNAGEAVYVIPFNAEKDELVYDQTTGDNGAWFPGTNGSIWDKFTEPMLSEEQTGDTGVWFPGSNDSQWKKK